MWSCALEQYWWWCVRGLTATSPIFLSLFPWLRALWCYKCFQLDLLFKEGNQCFFLFFSFLLFFSALDLWQYNFHVFKSQALLVICAILFNMKQIFCAITPSKSEVYRVIIWSQSWRLVELIIVCRYARDENDGLFVVLVKSNNNSEVTNKSQVFAG